MKQYQIPAEKMFCRGDAVSYELECTNPVPGRAFLRTTLGNACIRFKETVDRIEDDNKLTGKAWHDLEMDRISSSRYRITIPLTECGVFESKCFFIPDDMSLPIRWPAGDNFTLKVGNPVNAGGNTMYTAFVRLFDFRNTDKNVSCEELKKSEKLLDDADYAVIPPSGTFRQLISKLDFIMNDMKCRIVQLLPVHPVPVEYGRMGRFGSPFAATDYFAVDPALADFDEKATPLEQFGELLDAVHARGGRLFMDIPVNHTGWASKLQSEHPDYFVRESDGTFVSPGAWGTVWEDLCKLDYSRNPIILFMAKVFLFWCRMGVDGFRCDAGYMLPEKAWEYIVAKVRLEYQDTVFMLEGLGGRIEVQNKLLNPTGLDWAYSELFQNYSRDAISGYLQYMQYLSAEFGPLVNFAETHDNDRIAKKGRNYAAVRMALTALSAPAGAFGFCNGVEFLATEKINVHEKTSLNWGTEENLIPLIRLLNTLLNNHEAFALNSSFELIPQNGNGIVFVRRSRDGMRRVLVIINLSMEHSFDAVFSASVLDDWQNAVFLDGKYRNISVSNGRAGLSLEVGEWVVIGTEPEFFEKMRMMSEKAECFSKLSYEQQLKAAVLKIYTAVSPYPERLDSDFDMSCMLEIFRESPFDAVRKISGSLYPEVLRFELETDIRRQVMAGGEKLLLIRGENYFHASLSAGKHNFDSEYAVKVDDGYAALLKIPQYKEEYPRELELKFSVFENGVSKNYTGHLLQLGQYDIPQVKLRRNHKDIDRSTLALLSNENNSMSYIRGRWSSIESKYDAILAGNCNPQVPVDRRVMFSNLRAWIVVNDFSQALDFNVQKSFTGGNRNIAEWIFEVPVGQGAMVNIIFRIMLAENGNAVRILMIRPEGIDAGHLASEIPVKLILRPDVDDRINHTVTKAYMGAEKTFPASLRVMDKGFYFGPDSNCQLEMTVDNGRFVREDEWRYNQFLAAENYYGLEDHTDIYSPGYFELKLSGGQTGILTAGMLVSGMIKHLSDFRWGDEKIVESMLPGEIICEGLRRFIVKRDEFKTVIAGYPWFLDWGRDTLIVLRGLTDAGFEDESLAILRQFAKFEKDGTLPNMIRGNDDSNRDTTDAPLWFFVAVHDFIDKFNRPEILQMDNGAGRTVLECMESIVRNYIAGTPNWIKADPETMLIYNPPHFTWMDTNYPAGTPREGYPVEIQALWYHALEFLGRYRKDYKKVAEKVAENFEKYFYRKDLQRYSDCIHVHGGFAPVSSGTADDHIRPNQLFAITLGLIKDPEKMPAVIDNCGKLVIPGGIRSLADAGVEYKLPVYLNGQLLNDPGAPYQGSYNGPEDTSRKVSYHNGTAWCWVFPSYCEALYLAGGEKCRHKAMMLLLSSVAVLEGGIPGQLPEIIEGSYPHQPGGCPAQAWSMSEFGRVYHLLEKKKEV